MKNPQTRTDEKASPVKCEAISLGAGASQNRAVNALHSVPLTPYVREACDNYDKLKASAEKLAEALRHLMAITRNDKAMQYLEAKAALAQWDKQ